MAGATETPRRSLVVVTPDWSDGGVERVVGTLLANLEGRALTSLIVTGHISGGPYVPRYVEVIQLGYDRVRQAGVQLYRWLREQEPSAILSVKDHLSALAMPLARAAGVPVRAAAIHSAFAQHGEHRRGWSGALLPIALRLGLAHATDVIAITESQRIALEQHGVDRNRICVIENPIIDAHVLASPDREIDERLVPPGSGPLVVTACRLVADKDVATLLGAIGLTQDARLLVLGDGPERSNLEAMAAALGLGERVRFAGFQPDAPAYLARADVVALTSRVEALPTLLIESLALGKPIVATTSSPAVAELLDHGRHGWLAPVGDAHAVASAVRAAVCSPAPTPPDLSHFTIETSVARYIQVLRL